MMPGKGTSRRDYLKFMAAGAGLAATAPAGWAQEAVKKAMTAEPQAPPPDHDRRIQWWQEAKFGMFIHWGLYSLIGRHEWAMEMEGILSRNMKCWPNISIPSPTLRASGRSWPGKRGRNIWL